MKKLLGAGVILSLIVLLTIVGISATAIFMNFSADEMLSIPDPNLNILYLTDY